MVEYHLFWSFCGQNDCYDGFPDFRKDGVQPYFTVVASEWIVRGHFIRGQPSIKMRQTIKWCSAVCLTIVRPNMFWLLQSLLIFYQTILFGQAISLLPNMYSIIYRQAEAEEASAGTQEHTSANHLQVLFPSPVHFSYKSLKKSLSISGNWQCLYFQQLC